MAYLISFSISVFSSGAHGGGGDHGNATIFTDAALRHCGANFCTNLGGNANIQRPPDSEIFTISTIYLTCIFVASIMVALFVDPLSRSTLSHREIQVVRKNRQVVTESAEQDGQCTKSCRQLPRVSVAPTREHSHTRANSLYFIRSPPQFTSQGRLYTSKLQPPLFL
ncbi:potassium channel regulator activity protein [Homalodisca vitripennis]|nr:potassium channel regulator activity protein [Homalodisca vitripennis]